LPSGAERGRLRPHLRRRSNGRYVAVLAGATVQIIGMGPAPSFQNDPKEQVWVEVKR